MKKNLTKFNLNLFVYFRFNSRCLPKICVNKDKNLFQFQAELFDLEPEHFKPNITNETIAEDWNPVTSSKLTLIIDDTIMTSGNLKIKCVVDSFELYHKSNEISIETFGLKPTPKSVQLQPQQTSTNAEVTFEAIESTESSRGCHGIFTISNSLLINLYLLCWLVK